MPSRCRRPRKPARPDLWDEVVVACAGVCRPSRLPRGEFRRKLIACLRQGRKRRHPRSRGRGSPRADPNLVSIHERLAEVEARRVPGHWEGGLLKGSRNPAAVETLVEWRTRLVLLAKHRQHRAQRLRRVFPQVLTPVGKPAPHAHLRPGQGDGASRGTHRVG